MFVVTLAACGGGGGSAGSNPNAPATPPASTDPAVVVGDVSLLFSSPELKSAGVAGTEVTVSALVKSANNTTIANVPVSFSADSGALSVVDLVTDKNGLAKALLSTSGNRTNRRITIKAVAGTKTSTSATDTAGTKSTSATVDVVGTTLTSVGPTAVTAGGTGDFVVTVKDSANVAIPNVPVTYASQRSNPIAVKTSSGGTATAPLTNAQGQVVLTLTASQSGSDALTFTAQGTSSTSTVSVNSTKLTTSVVDSAGNVSPTAFTGSSCQLIKVRYEINNLPQNGTVNVSTSRGNVYADSNCLFSLTASSVGVVNGDSQPAYVRSATAGVATITATIPGGPTAQTTLEFVAILTPSATLSVQAEPAVIGTNSGTSQNEFSTLTAVVRDGTAVNNFVKNATIEFTLVNDKSGGFLSNPSVVTTGSNGAASVTFVAGNADTPRDGITVQAKIQGTATTATTKLTVSKKSLFIAAGTGNKILTPTDTTYEQDYAVFVTDASGNPVPNVTITAAILPTRYSKGQYGYDSVTAKLWVPTVVDTCLNEDVNSNGILDAGEDFNGNGILDPGIPLSITSSGLTDATGTAKISILYPRDRANWTEVKLTVRGTVAGTESTYQTSPYFLPVLSDDLNNAAVSPPGVISPYGINACTSKN
jgi:hypothetical protein